MIYVLLSANVVMVLGILLSFRTLPPVVPLLYSRPAGELQLVDWWLIIIVPVVMNMLYVLNNFLIQKIFSGSEFAKKIIWYTNLVIILLLTAVFIKVLTLVS